MHCLRVEVSSYCVKITDLCNKPIQAAKEMAGGSLMNGKISTATKITGWRRLIKPIGSLRHRLRGLEGNQIDC